MIKLKLTRKQVYLPAIIGLVNNEIVKTISAFLDFIYLARRQDLDEMTLKDLNKALTKSHTAREVFQRSGVRPLGFNLLRQHSLLHYHRHITEFGAPNGLCLSITESHHITAVKKSWRRLDQNNALGQMLLTNQRLDKLAALYNNFVACGMLPRHYAALPTMTEAEDVDGGLVGKERVTAHVTPGRSPGK